MTPPTKSAPVHPGLGWSRFGFGLGVVASTGANIAHSFTPSTDVVRRTTELAAATGRTVDWSTWTPPVGTIIAAAFWPIALVVSVEVISRVMWPEGWRWKLMRFGGVAIVAAVAAFISYKHLHGLIGSYGEDAWSSAVGPLAIDGLMVVCSAALLAIGQDRRSATKPVHVPAKSAPVHVAEPVRVDQPVARSTSAPKPARRPAKPAAKPATKTPAPRVRRMVETLKADYPAGTPGPETVQAVVDRYDWRKQDATEAVRIFREDAERSTPLVHVIPDSPAELDRVAV